MMKDDRHTFKGMGRSTHQIRQDSSLLWDAYNINLEEHNGDTRFSITNLKKDEEVNIDLSEYGSYVGHCVVGDYLVIFSSDTDYSNIVRIRKNKDTLTPELLFRTDADKWNSDYPIEAIGVIETDKIQKVYWVDGINQPRMINITKPELKQSLGEEAVYDEIKGYTDCYNGVTSFDFCPAINLNETISVKKEYGNGSFSPGVIQYAFSYYYLHGQETCIFNYTHLLYISYKDRGANSDEVVSNSFKITLENVDTNFDGIKVYSIQRTSIDGTPIVKLVGNIEINKNSSTYTFIDNGTKGESVDESLLLYLGGDFLIANTLTSKNNTLFLGNIQIKNIEKKIHEIIDPIKNQLSSRLNDLLISFAQAIKSGVYYDYTPNTEEYNAHFKTNEKYRIGLQFQYETGKWTSPIFIGLTCLSPVYPWNQVQSSSVLLNSDELDKLGELGIKRVRSCVVFPQNSERTILYQGIINPTVFNLGMRAKNYCYTMSSWFFRPDVKKTENQVGYTNGSNIRSSHLMPLYTSCLDGAEVQNSLTKGDNLKAHQYKDDTDVANYGSAFFVDRNVLTFHSPDVEFSDYHPNEELNIRILGLQPLSSTYGEYNITAGTPLSPKASGVIGGISGFTTGSFTALNNGMAVAPIFDDSSVTLDYKDNENVNTQYFIYPWHRSGSLNNDTKRPDDKGAQTAVLEKKQLFNLKFFDNPISFIDGSIEYSDIIFQRYDFLSNNIIRLKNPYNGNNVEYLGSVDTAITTNNAYPIYAIESGSYKQLDGNYVINTGKEPVRMKYKSSAHLVFTLGTSKEYSASLGINILPSYTNTISTPISYPSWLTGNTVSSIGETVYTIYAFGSLSDVQVTDAPAGTVFVSKSGSGALAALLIIGGIDGRTPVSMAFDTDYILKAQKGYTYYNSSEFGQINNTTPQVDGNSKFSKDTYYKYRYNTGSSTSTFEEIKDYNNKQPDKYYATQPNINSKIDDIIGINKYAYLLFAEVYRKEKSVDIDISDNYIQSLLWLPASDPILLEKSNETDAMQVPYIYGDTWYSRYNCLKTYPYTLEDENSVIEIGSFMCETRINLDAFTDRNRGNYPLFSASPDNFNTRNPVYEQKDNFFPNRILDKALYETNKFPTQVVWSQEKHNASEVDEWTNISLASPLDLPGDKGNLTALKTYRDTILAFQDKSISVILYNDRVQIPVSDGVPIEITNGMKVQGYKGITDNIGCQYKWSICQSDNALYFIDKYNSGLYRLKDINNIENISQTHGIQWILNAWNDKDYDLKLFSDYVTDNVYIYPAHSWYYNSDEVGLPYYGLYFSEKLDSFISRIDIPQLGYMFNFNEKFYSITDNLGIYKPFSSDKRYSNWSITFISNPEAAIVKIFDTIELHADLFDDYGQIGKIVSHNEYIQHPFNYINVTNEYQSTGTIRGEINTIDGRLREKFRTWRMHIPRSGRDRILNTWAEIQLSGSKLYNKETKKFDECTNPVIIHDINVRYSV